MRHSIDRSTINQTGIDELSGMTGDKHGFYSLNVAILRHHA
jgi:hypothetical protein